MRHSGTKHVQTTETIPSSGRSIMPERKEYIMQKIKGQAFDRTGREGAEKDELRTTLPK